MTRSSCGFVVCVVALVWAGGVSAQPAAVKATVPAPKTLRVAVDVIGLEPADQEAAAGLQKLAVETLGSYRNWPYKPFFTDVDTESLKELDREIGLVLKKLQEPKPERHVRDAQKALDSLFVKVKERLGEVSFETVARLYRALGMAKILAEDLPLAEKYLHVWLNLLPGEGAQVMRNEPYRNLATAAGVHRAEAGSTEVTITCDSGVTVTVNGTVTGSCPLVVTLGMGDHLVQASKEGFYRFGALRSVDEFGTTWNVALQSLHVLGRYERLVRELTALYAASADPSWQKVEPYLASIAQLKEADLQLLLLVHLVPEGVRLQGGFWSAKGSVSWGEVVARDARFLDYVKGRILQICDLPAIESASREKRVDAVRAELDAWELELRTELESMKESLEKRGAMWARIGEMEKSEFFRQLVLDIGVLLQDLAREIQKAGDEPSKRRKALADGGERAKALTFKGRTMLAWDVEGALAAKRTRDMSQVVERATLLVKDARKLFGDAAGRMDSKRRADLERRLNLLKSKEAGVAKALKADPEGNLASTRTLLYDWLIKAAEVVGLLTTK